MCWQTMLSNNLNHELRLVKDIGRSPPNWDNSEFHMHRETLWRGFDVMITMFHLTLLQKVIVWRSWIDPQYIQVWVIYRAIIEPSQIQIRSKKLIRLWCSSPYVTENKTTLSHIRIKSNQFISFFLFDWWLNGWFPHQTWWLHGCFFFFPYLKYHALKRKLFALYCWYLKDMLGVPVVESETIIFFISHSSRIFVFLLLLNRNLSFLTSISLRYLCKFYGVNLDWMKRKQKREVGKSYKQLWKHSI